MKFVCIVLILLLSCGGNAQLKQSPVSSETPSSKPPVKQKNQDVPKFSVVKYDIDDIEIKRKEIVADKKEASVKIVSVKGFRLQIAALSDFNRTKEIEKRLSEELAQSEHAVHVDFYSPNYRIRVGDFKTRDEAKKIIPMLKNLGYRDCFIVPDKVTLVLNEKPQ